LVFSHPACTRVLSYYFPLAGTLSALPSPFVVAAAVRPSSRFIEPDQEEKEEKKKSRRNT
jgi:ABC-type Fe2+-enterobactin transport system substrate-binding protein